MHTTNYRDTLITPSADCPAVAGTTLVLYFDLMRLKRYQQRRVLFPTQNLSAGKT